MTGAIQATIAGRRRFEFLPNGSERSRCGRIMSWRSDRVRRIARTPSSCAIATRMELEINIAAACRPLAGVVGHVCPIFLALQKPRVHLEPMRAADLIRAVERCASRRGLDFENAPGKGSHRKIRLGKRRSVVPVHSGDLPKGTYRAILKQLDLSERDLED